MVVGWGSSLITPKKGLFRTMAIKPRGSSKLDEEEDGGSQNLPLGAESLRVEMCSMVTKRIKERER
jgi:hypothetical protein